MTSPLHTLRIVNKTTGASEASPKKTVESLLVKDIESLKKQVNEMQETMKRLKEDMETLMKVEEERVRRVTSK
jgi:hypothetical protein